jgi:hypothetical protein
MRRTPDPAPIPDVTAPVEARGLDGVLAHPKPSGGSERMPRSKHESQCAWRHSLGPPGRKRKASHPPAQFPPTPQGSDQ